MDENYYVLNVKVRENIWKKLLMIHTMEEKLNEENKH